MRDDGALEELTGPRRDRSGLDTAMWMALLPLLLVLHPYAGLVQDARIYIGRGLADRDPTGIGRDVMFAHDGQTGFTLMRGLVDLSLGAMAPETSAIVLTLVGAAAWLVALVTILRSVSTGRVAWAAAVCAVALPTTYGAYDVFNYAEAIATPRVFAQAAVLAGLAALLAGRRSLGAVLLALAILFHPLIALPGCAVGASLLVRGDRRWGWAILAAASAVIGAAIMGVPVVARLIQPMDAEWLSILRQRSSYLFPTQWPVWSFGPIVCQGTALVAASRLTGPAARAFFHGLLGVAAAGLAASWLFGDLLASTLIVQLQPWRALWLLAVLGNAAFALVAVALWRRGSGACLIVVPLALAWLWSDNLMIACIASLVTLGLLVAVLRDAVPAPSPLVLCACAGVLGAVAFLEMKDSASVAVLLFRSASKEDGRVAWPMLAGLRMQMVPLVACALALAVIPGRYLTAAVRSGLIAAVVVAAGLAAWLWDGRTTEKTLAAWKASVPALRAAVGSRRGEVLWVDEDSESWFLLNRPSFLNSAQAGPILFSRDLALEWADRVRLLTRLGLARPEDAAPWGGPSPNAAEIVLTAEAVQRFCADGRHPAAVIAPGDQRAAAPSGARATLWRPPEPLHRVVIGQQDFHWRTITALTVIACSGDASAAPGRAMAEAGTRDRSGD